MTDKELKQLSRKKLLEMLIELESENAGLRAELEQAQSNTAAESVILDPAHPFSEVAVKVNAIFRAADEAARQYLENLRLASERQQAAENGTADEAVNPLTAPQTQPAFITPADTAFDAQPQQPFASPVQSADGTQPLSGFTAPAQPAFGAQPQQPFTSPVQPADGTQPQSDSDAPAHSPLGQQAKPGDEAGFNFDNAFPDDV